MLVATQGFVLHTTPYSESSVIAKVFTRQLGVKSYIIKGVRSPKSRIKQNLLQPLSYLDMVVYNNPKITLNYVKELHPACQFTTIASDYSRTAIVFFMNELLYKTLQEEEPNTALFDFVAHTLQETDTAPRVPDALPIIYLIHLSRFLGIEPMDNYSLHEPLFNIKEGRYQAPPSHHSALSDPNADYCLGTEISMQLHYYLDNIHHHAPSPIFPLSVRINLINTLLLYYKTHLSDFKNFKSHEVLHAVLQ